MGQVKWAFLFLFFLNPYLIHARNYDVKVVFLSNQKPTLLHKIYWSYLAKIKEVIETEAKIPTNLSLNYTQQQSKLYEYNADLLIVDPALIQNWQKLTKNYKTLGIHENTERKAVFLSHSNAKSRLDCQKSYLFGPQNTFIGQYGPQEKLLWQGCLGLQLKSYKYFDSWQALIDEWQKSPEAIAVLPKSIAQNYSGKIQTEFELPPVTWLLSKKIPAIKSGTINKSLRQIYWDSRPLLTPLNFGWRQNIQRAFEMNAIFWSLEKSQ